MPLVVRMDTETVRKLKDIPFLKCFPEKDDLKILNFSYVAKFEPGEILFGSPFCRLSSERLGLLPQ